MTPNTPRKCGHKFLLTATCAVCAEWLRDKLVAEVYTPEGITIWLRHAEKQGWTLKEQIGRLRAATEGVFV